MCFVVMVSTEYLVNNAAIQKNVIATFILFYWTDYKYPKGFQIETCY